MQASTSYLNTPDEKRAFYRRVLILVLPIVGTNLIDALVTSADVVMLGFVSQTALSAVSLAANVQFVLSIFMFGLATGSAMLSAQYWGKHDVTSIEKILGIVLRLSLSVSLVFTVAAFAVPDMLMRIFTPDEALIAEGVVYLRIVALTYLMTGFSMMYLNILKSMERVTISTLVYFISFATNVALNAFFIFVMHYGAKGVAIGTLAARFVEFAICAVHAMRNKKIRVRLKYIFVNDKVLFKDFIHFALPALGNDIVWGVGFTMYTVIIGHMSSDAVAAYSIVSVARKLGSVMCFGVSSGCSIMVGKALGSDLMEEAELYAKRMLNLAIITALIGGAVILLMIPIFMWMGNLTPVALSYLKGMLIINSYYIMGQSVNTLLICGVFRSGGDSRFGFICDLIDLWVVMVPVGILCAFVFKLPVMVVYFILCLDEFIKMPFIVVHYRKRGWLKNITRELA